MLKNDLTRNQRRYFKTLQSELNRRLANGERNLTIRYVDNVPTIVDSQKNA